MGKLIMLIALGTLVSCSAPTVDELENNVLLLEKVSKKCSAMSSDDAKEEEACRNAWSILTKRRMESQESINRELEKSHQALMDAEL